MERYLSLTVDDLNRVARKYLRPELSVELEYLSAPAE